jgi:hypothetical protein
MLEIDGEFFENPCDLMRAKKIKALTEIALKATLVCLKTDNPKMKKLITDTAIIQSSMIAAEPLFPHSPRGGIIINRPPLAGDIIRL